jgi:hypothetical protein
LPNAPPNALPAKTQARPTSSRRADTPRKVVKNGALSPAERAAFGLELFPHSSCLCYVLCAASNVGFPMLEILKNIQTVVSELKCRTTGVESRVD